MLCCRSDAGTRPGLRNSSVACTRSMDVVVSGIGVPFRLDVALRFDVSDDIGREFGVVTIFDAGVRALDQDDMRIG